MMLFRGAVALAAVVHVLFFWLEAVRWRQPKVHRGVFRVETQELADRLAPFMLNQGAYNLMLAAGAGLGAALATSASWGGAAVAIGGFSAACMVGAALTLLFSAPGMIRGVILQGAPPTVALVGLWLAVG